MIFLGIEVRSNPGRAPLGTSLLRWPHPTVVIMVENSRTSYSHLARRLDCIRLSSERETQAETEISVFLRLTRTIAANEETKIIAQGDTGADWQVRIRRCWVRWIRQNGASRWPRRSCWCRAAGGPVQSDQPAAAGPAILELVGLGATGHVFVAGAGAGLIRRSPQATPATSPSPATPITTGSSPPSPPTAAQPSLPPQINKGAGSPAQETTDARPPPPSDRVGSQAVLGGVSSHGVPLWATALSMVRSLRMHATIATLKGLPLALSRW